MAGETTWLGSLGSWLGDGQNLQGIGTIIGAGGSIYGGIKSADIAKKNLAFQQKSYNDQWADYNSTKKKNHDAYTSVYGSGLGSYGGTV